MSNSSKYPSLRPLLFLSSACVVLTLVVFFISNLRMMQYRRDYKVDSKQFYDATVFAMTNYILPRLVSFTNQLPDSTVSRSEFEINPIFVRSPLGFYENYSGKQFAIIQGEEYSVGDYCDWGLIRSIDNNRLICQGTNGLVVVRPAPVSSVPARRSRAGTDEREEGEEI